MTKWISFCMLISFSVLLSFCNDDDESPKPNPPSPPIGTLSISNLEYSPREIPIEENQLTFTISGSLNFMNADGGPKQIKMSSSIGYEITVDVQGNEGQTNGLLTGYFEFLMPESPNTFTFEIWLIDGKGRSSNKLSGSIQVVIDDRMIYWKKIPLPDELWKINSILWVNSKLIAAGDDGLVLTSTNVYEWDQQTSGINVNLNKLCWSGSLFVAVGDYSTIITSGDGTNWSLRHFSESNQKLYGISWSGQQFVAVGRDSVNDKTIILTSPDGINWSTNSFTITGGELKSIAWSGNLFMAVGNQTSDPCCRTPQCICGYSPVLLTSPEGLNWTRYNLDGSAIVSALQDVCWDGTNFIVPAGFRVGKFSGGTLLAYEENYVEYIYRIIHTDKKYVGLGVNSSYGKDLLYSSSNGLNWYNNGQGLNLDIPGNTLRDIVWTGEKYIAVGLCGYIIVSPY